MTSFYSKLKGQPVTVFVSETNSIFYSEFGPEATKKILVYYYGVLEDFNDSELLVKNPFTKLYSIFNLAHVVSVAQEEPLPKTSTACDNPPLTPKPQPAPLGKFDFDKLSQQAVAGKPLS